MAEQTLFLFQPHGENEQHTVAKIEAGEAKRLTDEGKAIEVDLGGYDQYRQQVQQAHKKYKQAKKKIENSDHPSMTEDVKAYELDQAFNEFEKEANRLQGEWKAKREELQAEARAKSARATVNVSQGDKQTAEQVTNRISLDIASASSAAELNQAINKASQDIGYLSDAEKTALQSNVPGLLSQVDAKNEKFDSSVKGRKLINSAQDVRNLDLLAGKVADQLPPNVDMEYRQLRTIKRGHRVNPKSM